MKFSKDEQLFCLPCGKAGPFRRLLERLFARLSLVKLVGATAGKAEPYRAERGKAAASSLFIRGRFSFVCWVWAEMRDRQECLPYSNLTETNFETPASSIVTP